MFLLSGSDQKILKNELVANPVRTAMLPFVTKPFSVSRSPWRFAVFFDFRP